MPQKKHLLILFSIMITAFIQAQNFNYTLTKDSTAYTSLSSASFLTEGESWINKRFSLHLPFQFNFCGSSTDSLTIEGNGFIILDQAKSLSIVAFNSFRSNKDTNQNYVASIAYSNTGSPGNRIIKIEFKNISQNNLSGTDYLNYQVWLYENGNKIEFHIGSNYNGSHPESQTSALLGLVNRNMNSEDKAYIIKGNQYAPTGQLISGDSEFEYLDNIPSEGTILKLTPAF